MATSYTLNAGIVGAIEGTDTRWANLIANHAGIQDAYTPSIVDMPRLVTSTSTTIEDRLTFKIRRNSALHTVRFLLRAVANTGSGVITCSVGASSASAAISGAVAAYTVNVTGDDDATCIVKMKVDSPGDSITLSAIQVYIVTDGTEPDWVAVGTRWYTSSDAAIPAKIISDMRDGPTFLSQDRTVPLCYHIADIQQTVSSKNFEVWGTANATLQQPVGRLWIPRHDTAIRTCRLDAYTTATGSAAFKVLVGSQVWEWSSTGWSTTTMELGPGPHDVYAFCTPTASTNAAIRSLQIWRGDY